MFDLGGLGEFTLQPIPRPYPELMYAPYKQKVYLILLSVAFSGIFKSQGAEVKLMVCKTDSKQNAQKC
jgi:hypothetical protein